MAFGWAYVDCTGSGGGGTGGASGPSASIQFMTASGTGISSGSVNLRYDTTNSFLTLTGSLSVSGTISASHYHIKNVVEMDVSGNTFFGDTDGDIHARTGSLYVKNAAGDTNLSVLTTGKVEVRQFAPRYLAVSATPTTASHPVHTLGVRVAGQAYLMLPDPTDAAGSGSHLVVKDEVGHMDGTNITLNVAGGSLIDGASTYVLTGSRPAISLYSNGANYFVF